MKQIIPLLLLCLICSSSYAQKPTAAKAYNAYYEKDYAKAKEIIDQCIVDEKLGTKAQTWLYKANIDFYLANEEYGKKQQDNSYVIQYPTTPEESFDAFNKALEINKNIEAFEMFTPYDGKSQLYSLLLIYGVEQMLKNDFATGARILSKSVESYEMKEPEHNLHGELYYYYAYALEMLGEEENALHYYNKAIQDGYAGANVFIHLIEHYKKENNDAKILDLINTGKKTITDPSTILVAEVDYYWNKNQEKALTLLNALPQSVYSNSDATVNIANLYIKKEDYPKAIELLQKADRISPNNFVILYNLGFCNLRQYEIKFLESNKLAVDGNANQAEILSKEATNLLNNAESYFERALLHNPNDLTVLEPLKEIYARKLSPKYDDIVKKIETLKD